VLSSYDGTDQPMSSSSGYQDLPLPPDDPDIRPDDQNHLPDDLVIRSDDLGHGPDDLGIRPDDLGLGPDDLGIRSDDLGITLDDLGYGPDDLGIRPDDLVVRSDDLGFWPDDLGSHTPGNEPQPPSATSAADPAGFVTPQSSESVPLVSRSDLYELSGGSGEQQVHLYWLGAAGAALCLLLILLTAAVFLVRWRAAGRKKRGQFYRNSIAGRAAAVKWTCDKKWL
jgi:hypothetical protein